MCRLFLSSVGPLSPGKPVRSFIMGGASHTCLFPSRAPRPRPANTPLPCAAAIVVSTMVHCGPVGNQASGDRRRGHRLGRHGASFLAKKSRWKEQVSSDLVHTAPRFPLGVAPLPRCSPGQHSPHPPVAGADGCQWEFSGRLRPKFDCDHHSILSYILGLLGRYSA